MYIKQIYTSCLAQASYYIESNNEAIIIDPIRDSSIYIDLLRERSANLKYIFETHFHADFVSGHVELSQLTNSKIVFGPNANTNYDSIESIDGQKFICGNLIMQVLHTPGHTMESVCYLLLLDNIPQAVFTGDTLFIGEVGRPDLAVNPNLTQKDLAAMLYNSLHNKLLTLPDDVIVYPGHGAGSACGKNISSERHSTIGLQKQHNYALQQMSQDEFVQIVTSGISEAPNYFSHDVMMNKNGYNPVSSVLNKSLNQFSIDQVIDESNKGAVILDVRLPNEFEAGFIPGSINIGKTGMFAPWVGSLIDVKKRIIIICHNNEQKEVISRLARIGYENIIGYFNDLSNCKKLDSILSIHPSEICSYIDNSILLDVRKIGEMQMGYLKGSINLPVSTLESNIKTIDSSKKTLVYCAGGYRSMIAASILKSHGFKNVINIYGGFNAISQNKNCLDYIKMS